jgi:hypothetical protein
MQDIIRLNWSHGSIHLITNRTKTDRSPSIESQTRDFIEEKKWNLQVKKEKERKKQPVIQKRCVLYEMVQTTLRESIQRVLVIKDLSTLK